MPIMPIMPTPKNAIGGDTSRARAKKVLPSLTPMRDASPPQVPALCASVLCLSFELKPDERFTPRSSFRCPSP